MVSDTEIHGTSNIEIVPSNTEIQWLQKQKYSGFKCRNRADSDQDRSTLDAEIQKVLSEGKR